MSLMIIGSSGIGCDPSSRSLPYDVVHDLLVLVDLADASIVLVSIDVEVHRGNAHIRACLHGSRNCCRSGSCNCGVIALRVAAVMNCGSCQTAATHNGTMLGIRTGSLPGVI